MKFYQVDTYTSVGKYEYVNQMHKWIEKGLFLLGILFVVIAIFFPFKTDFDVIVLILFFLAFLSIRSFMEWKYPKTPYGYMHWVSYVFVVILLYAGSLFL